jgi:hypothetical protein
MSVSDIPASALGIVDTNVSGNQAVVAAVQQQISATQTFYRLTLKPLQNGPFAAQYDITVQNLQLPKQVDLSQ